MVVEAAAVVAEVVKDIVEDRDKVVGENEVLTIA